MVRFKNRYVLFEIHVENSHGLCLGDSSLNERLISKILKDNFLACFGEYNFGCVLQSLQLKYYNTSTGLGIVRIGRGYESLLISSLTYLTVIQQLHCQIQTLQLSGTLCSSQKAAIRYCRDQKVFLQQILSENLFQQMEADILSLQD
eukprot:Sdes_comp19174_c0_seq3m9971